MSDVERTRTALLLAAALLFVPCALHAQVQYLPPVHQTWPQPYPPPPTVTVDPSGGGNFTTITAAVNGVPTGTYIRVKAGVYHESGIDFGTKELVLESVDGQGLAVVEGGPEFGCTLGVSIFRLDHSQTGASVINGFKLRFGRARDGGAIHCNGTSPTIINNIFYKNSAATGGAIFAEFGSPWIAGNTFDTNGYGGGSGSCGPDVLEGGAIGVESSGAVVQGNLFVANRGELGGGIDAETNSHITLVDNIFTGNYANAPWNPGGVVPMGGALSVGTGSGVTALHNEFHDNVATANGGGVGLRGPVNYAIQFDYALFSGNEAQQIDGGGLYLTGASGTFTNCTFVENRCDHHGGGICVSGAGTPTFDLCSVHDNVAWVGGGGAAFEFDGSATITRSEIRDNDVVGGPNVGRGAGILVLSASATIRQNVIKGNGRSSSTIGAGGPKCWRGGGIDYGGAANGSSQGHIDANVITLNEVNSFQISPGEGAGVALKSMGAGSTFGSNVVAKNTLNNSIPQSLGVAAGVLVEATGSFRFYNNSIADNVNVAVGSVRGSGGGILFRNLTAAPSFLVHNTILWGNLAQQNGTNSDATVESLNVATLPTLFYCDTPNAPNASAPDWVAGTSGTGTPTVIHQNPFFVNPGAGNYHIPATSTWLVNTGYNGVVNVTIRPFDIDIDGALRITNPNGGGIVDLGADELP